MAARNTQAPYLSVEHKDIEFVEHLQYLGSNISWDDDDDYDIYTRIGKFHRCTDVFAQCDGHKISVKTQRCACTHQLSSHLPSTPVKLGGQLTRQTGCSVCSTEDDIMGVSWNDHMTNEELLLSAGVGDLQDIVVDRRRRFIRHVLHLPTSRPASLMTDWTLGGGSRRWSRPMQTWQDTCREDLQEMG